MIKIYDAPNHLRILLEQDPPPNIMRLTLAQVMSETSIWVWDGPNALAKRREVFPGYKVGRKAPDDSVYKMMDLFRELFNFTKAVQIRVPGYEADDVIAKLVAQISGNVPIQIISSDKDMLQLTALPGVSVTAKMPAGVMPEELRLYKTLCGDTSDKIPGIPGFGPKAWEKCDKGVWLDIIAYNGLWRVRELKLSDSKKDWIVQNIELLRSYWDIIGFYDVPMDLINFHTTAGLNDFARADALLKSFLQ